MALRDTKGDGRFDTKQHFGTGSTTGIALHNGYLYLAHPTSVERYKMTPGQLVPTGQPETIVAGFPLEREHEDKGIAFDGKGGMYINFGAPSNACQSRDRRPKSPGRTRARCSRVSGASGGSMRTRWDKNSRTA